MIFLSKFAEVEERKKKELVKKEKKINEES
jgi:hypothetical protein